MQQLQSPYNNGILTGSIGEVDPKKRSASRPKMDLCGDTVREHSNRTLMQDKTSCICHVSWIIVPSISKVSGLKQTVSNCYNCYVILFANSSFVFSYIFFSCSKIHRIYLHAASWSLFSSGLPFVCLFFPVALVYLFDCNTSFGCEAPCLVCFIKPSYNPTLPPAPLSLSPFLFVWW